MKKFKFNYLLIIILITLSVIFFILQQIFFHNLEESGFLFFQDLIFLPLSVLLVTFVLDRVLHEREKRERVYQLDIIIGAFFSEMGLQSFRELNKMIDEIIHIQSIVSMNEDWSNKDFDRAAKKLIDYHYKIKENKLLLAQLKNVLLQKKDYLVSMFNNPNLLEHNTFIDMLWALYHLMDELENRVDIDTLPKKDIHHLLGDIQRAYRFLIYEWVFYMKHLKNRYPYLWSIAVRKDPFVENPSVIITK